MRTFVYRGRNRTVLDVHLRLLDFALGAEADGYESVLVTLGEGIRKSVRLINRAPENDLLVDAETDFIENMLGTVYVVCQNAINAVVQASLEDVPDKELFGSGTRKNVESKVRALGPRFNRKFSKIEVLRQLGNYFKHRDEWHPISWKGASSWTLKAIKAAGLRPGSSGGNLRRAAEALGNSDYSDVTLFVEIIRAWSEDVRKQIDVKLGRGP
jgi:hypothetical protein